MSTLAPAGRVPARRVWLYPLGALLGGCAVSGHAPLWMIPLWAVTLGWWCQEDRRRRMVYSLPILLALLPAWPLHSQGFAFTGVYLQVVLAGVAVALFLNGLEHGSGPLGLVALALGFVLAPTPLAVFGLLGALLLRAQVMQRGTRQLTSPRALGWLAALIVGVALLSALLPRPSGPHLYSGADTAAVHSQPQASATPTLSSGLRKVPSLPSGQNTASGPQSLGERMLEAIFPYFLVVGLAFLLVAVTLLLTRRARSPGMSWRIEDLLLAAAIAVAVTMVLLWAYLQNTLGRAGGGGPSGQQAAGSTALGHAGALNRALSIQIANVFGWIAVVAIILFALLLILAVVFMILHRGGGELKTQETATATPISLQDASAEHRVRRAYREMLELLSEAGLVRAPTETPHEFLARLSGERPELAADATQLTDLYEPVRYGAQMGEQGAQAAETALVALRGRLAAPPKGAT